MAVQVFALNVVRAVDYGIELFRNFPCRANINAGNSELGRLVGWVEKLVHVIK